MPDIQVVSRERHAGKRWTRYASYAFASTDAVAPLVALLSDADAEATALLERAVLRRLEAGCAAPVGITAVVSGDDVSLVAEVYALDGTRAVRVERTFARAAVAGTDGRRDAAEAVVRELLDAGAGDLADLAGSGK